MKANDTETVSCQVPSCSLSSDSVKASLSLLVSLLKLMMLIRTLRLGKMYVLYGCRTSSLSTAITKKINVGVTLLHAGSYLKLQTDIPKTTFSCFCCNRCISGVKKLIIYRSNCSFFICFLIKSPYITNIMHENEALI